MTTYLPPTAIYMYQINYRPTTNGSMHTSKKPGGSENDRNGPLWFAIILLLQHSTGACNAFSTSHSTKLQHRQQHQHRHRPPPKPPAPPPPPPEPPPARARAASHTSTSTSILPHFTPLHATSRHGTARHGQAKHTTVAPDSSDTNLPHLSPRPPPPVQHAHTPRT